MGKMLLVTAAFTVLLLSARVSSAGLADADDFAVPDGGSTMVLAGAAVAVIAGFSRWVRKKD